ncbi:MAG: 4-hydroxy-tetrahydrodipicolinate reductase [Bacteroidia bacterium]|jgi:4-hydroxy-tetrahydrodipicolinate reductase
MKIALIGYGKMGRMLHALLEREGKDQVVILGREQNEAWKNELSSCDVAIEFTRPDQAVSNLKTCFECGVPVVCGTTGWLAQIQEVTSICNTQNGSLFYASNFSIGVHLFIQLNSWYARFMQTHPEYAISMEEIHHIHKKDAPSGTGISVANAILAQRNDYQSWIEGEPSTSEILPIHSIREGETIGTHSVYYRSTHDEIQLTHKAYSREGFAAGAIAAARFLHGKRGVFTMNDLIQS